MSKRIVIHGRDGYVDHFGRTLEFFRKERGTEAGSSVPTTTYADVMQTALWWNKETERHFERRSHGHPYDDRWAQAMAKVRRDSQGNDPNALYPDNAWFWSAVRQQAVHLENERVMPTKMELILESIQEAVDDRIDDVQDLVTGAADAAGAVVSGVGKAADAVAETGASLWAAVKVVAVVGVVGIGAALIVPPIVRAARARDREEDQP